MRKPSLDPAAVLDFLAGRHPQPVTDLEPLSGGFWSAAFSYRTGGRELVARFGPIREGFEADRLAMSWASPALPVPEVLEIGDALGMSYALSVRQHGTFLEDVTPDDADRSGPALAGLLGALFAVPAGKRPGNGWRAWLVASLKDAPGDRTSGWRATLAHDAGLDRLFRECERRVMQLADACPERRDLVHGDLLHRNVLVSDDAAKVTAVFSWKCSQRGDFLFDTAWCTFWGESFHRGIAAADVWSRVTSDPSVRTAEGALVDAAVRHHCYELQIAASHLAWHTWTGEHDHRSVVAAHAAMLLERGPRASQP